MQQNPALSKLVSSRCRRHSRNKFVGLIPLHYIYMSGTVKQSSREVLHVKCNLKRSWTTMDRRAAKFQLRKAADGRLMDSAAISLTSSYFHPTIDS